MNPLLAVPISARALLRNKLRSFLTTLGVIIGVGAVVAMTALGAGARTRIDRTFQAMGSHMLIVRAGSSFAGGVRGGAGTRLGLTWEDLDAIAREVPAVRHVAPLLSRPAQVLADGQNWATSVQGTTPPYFAIRNWSALRGGFFDDDEARRGAQVAVLGSTVADRLFGRLVDPIGRTIRVNQVPFDVIGVARSRGQTSAAGDQDDVVLVPVRAFRSRLAGDLDRYLNGHIYVGAQSQAATTAVQAGIEALLRARHQIRPGEEDDFVVRNLADAAAAQQEGARVMTSLLAGIALVSLVVGGIGIMNIMLVSVTERTREIGLRMAVGAKPRDVLLQFVVESVSLSLLGGTLGVAAGAGTALALAQRFGWTAELEPAAAALAFASSAVVGVTFGLYPAYRASRLDPIQALRWE